MPKNGTNRVASEVTDYEAVQTPTFTGNWNYLVLPLGGQPTFEKNLADKSDSNRVAKFHSINGHIKIRAIDTCSTFDQTKHVPWVGLIALKINSTLEKAVGAAGGGTDTLPIDILDRIFAAYGYSGRSAENLKWVIPMSPMKIEAAYRTTVANENTLEWDKKWKLKPKTIGFVDELNPSDACTQLVLIVLPGGIGSFAPSVTSINKFRYVERSALRGKL